MNKNAIKEDNVTKSYISAEDKQSIIELLKQITGVKKRLEEIIKNR